MTKTEIEADIAALAKAIEGEPKTLFVPTELLHDIKRLGVGVPENINVLEVVSPDAADRAVGFYRMRGVHARAYKGPSTAN